MRTKRRSDLEQSVEMISYASGFSQQEFRDEDFVVFVSGGKQFLEALRRRLPLDGTFQYRQPVPLVHGTLDECHTSGGKLFVFSPAELL